MDTAAVSNIALLIVTLLGMYLSAFWLALIIWTYRDHRSRSRDGLASLAAALMVAILNLPGLLIYLLLRPKETLAEAYERSLEEEALLQEIEEKPICPGCGRPTNPDWQVCPYCHTTLRKACTHCGKMLELAWKLCPHCATPQPGYTRNQDYVEIEPEQAPLYTSEVGNSYPAVEEPLQYIDDDPYQA